jgi:hypothetical protein
MEWYIIDGIGPFFKQVDQEVINWSKAPFEHLESNGLLLPERCQQIADDFKRFCTHAAAAGYNAVTLDDVAHLCLFPFYPASLKQKIESYRHLYEKLFAIASEANLRILITTDLLFFNQYIEKNIDQTDLQLRNFAANCCRQVLERFPVIAGIIFRIGESDGLDVGGDFTSRLIIHRPVQARAMLQTLIRLFEELDRQLIFRTWSVGVGRIGDIIWNHHTFDQVFSGLESPNLIISMKYGASDFFRFLPLNRLFFRCPHRKIIELQTRREYEGFGEYPSFVGWDYEAYRNQLVGAQNMVGISVWCQTGGWSGFRRLTWLDNSSVWTEINTFVTARIFRQGLSADQAIQQYYREHVHHHQWLPLKELLKLSDEVIKELLYIDEFANRSIYFRRLRVPPLIHVYWRHIIVSHFMRKLLRCYVSNGPEKVKQGQAALLKIDRMIELARQLNMPTDGLYFQRDTFELLATVRAYYFLPYSEELIEHLKTLRDQYEARYPEPRYSLQLDTNRMLLRRGHLALLLRILFRGEHGYRLFDRVILLNLLSLIYPLIKRLRCKIFPDFASGSAMGIDTIFK